jgi:hypothetical protein
VVRELSRKRVWFAESLISSTAAEVRRLLVQSREWAARLGKPVRGWMSDKQEAFRSGIAAEFPGVPHRSCRNHFLRDLAQPVLDLDSHAKVQMRAKVRGFRAIEREVLQARRPRAAASSPVLEQAGASAAPLPVQSLAVAEPLVPERYCLRASLSLRRAEFIPLFTERIEIRSTTKLPAGGIMRRARSGKNRPVLLMELEKRYRASS